MSSIAGFSIAPSSTRSSIKPLRISWSTQQRNVKEKRFKVPSDLQSILKKYLAKEDVISYEQLCHSLRNTVLYDKELHSLLCVARSNIKLLSKEVQGFVVVILKIRWSHRSESVAKEYEAFLVDLLSSHNYYTKIVLEEIIATFKSEECHQIETVKTGEGETCNNNLHNVLKILLGILPMTSNVLLQVVKAQYPYMRNSAKEHESFVANILKITTYKPDLRCDIFFLVIERLIILDVNAPRQDVQEAETECETEAAECQLLQSDNCMKHVIANTLDVTLVCLFKYINSLCYDGDELNCEKTMQFYQDLLTVFEEVVLPTDATHYIQFLIFYLCSFSATVVKDFIDFLWNKSLADDVDLGIKHKTIAYIASLISRAEFISVRTAQGVIIKMASWIHGYIDRREGLDFILSDLRMHPVFYSLCQALFYIVTFRHEDLLTPKNNLQVVQKLNLARIISCRLNPLRVCRPDIVNNFAAVANTYQLAYCDPVIEQNSRNTLPQIQSTEYGPLLSIPEEDMLDGFFPFDPFILVRSNEIISPLYREFQPPVEQLLQEIPVGEDDDFM